MKKAYRVAIGMSGGVDSSVAAYLLRQKGLEVVGVFMRNWDQPDEIGECSADKELEDAAFVCRKVGIPLHEVNFVKEYWNSVFSELMKDYEDGLTPNPDVLCNRHIKFDAFYKHCKERMGVDAIAMGHYVRTSFGPYLENYVPNANVKLLLPEDSTKDQTFFLSRTPQEALRHCSFPLGPLLKSAVRNIAKEINLEHIATKKDSTGICFVGKRNFPEFINQYMEPSPGNFVDIDTGKIVGRHNGVHQWTLGQRCMIGGLSTAYFVARKQLKTKTIYVASGTNHPALYANSMVTKDNYWICGSEPKELTINEKLECRFRFQNVMPLVPCTISRMTDSTLQVDLLNGSLRALTPGQIGVFYKNNECIGSGKIHTVLTSYGIFSS